MDIYIYILWFFFIPFLAGSDTSQGSDCRMSYSNRHSSSLLEEERSPPVDSAEEDTKEKEIADQQDYALSPSVEVGLFLFFPFFFSFFVLFVLFVFLSCFFVFFLRLFYFIVFRFFCSFVVVFQLSRISSLLFSFLLIVFLLF